jgi:hypothetical protein
VLRYSDRRQTQRFDLEIPLSIRTLELPEAPARMAMSSNISATGICVATDLMLRVGTPIEISIRMPEQVSGLSSDQWCYRGRVVRIECADRWRKKLRLGVVFHYYEVLKNAGARSPNPISGEME